MKGQKVRRKLFPVLLAIAMMTATFGNAVIAYAEEDNTGMENSLDVVALEDAVQTLAGSGTQEDPYQIYTAADLAALDGVRENANAILMADIDFSGLEAKTYEGWADCYINCYYGILDGNGHKIYGTDDQTFVIYAYCGSQIKDLEFNIANNASHLLLYQKGAGATYQNLTVTGNVLYTADNVNESPVVTYAEASILFDHVTIAADIQSPTYQGLFIGYEPCKGYNYAFTGCKVTGEVICRYTGILFGNGSMGADSASYGMQHILNGNSTVTVEDLVIEGTILATGDTPHLLCGVSYNAASFESLEQSIAAKTTGTENLSKTVELTDYQFELNEDGRLRIRVTGNANPEIGSFVVVSEVYANAYTNGKYNGTQKSGVSEKILVQDGVNEYYSTLGQIEFTDAVEGTYSTTGENGQIRLITVDGKTYYRMLETADTLTFGSTGAVTNTSRVSSVSVFVYNTEGKLINVVSGPKAETFTAPTVSAKEAFVGDKLSAVSLEDGWIWLNENITVTEGGQTAFARKGNQVIPVQAEGIVLGQASALLKAGETITLTADIRPENTTDKTIVWTSSDTSIATVDANGVITGVGAGKANITAKSGNVSAACTVTVYEVETPETPEADLTKPVETVTVAVSNETNSQVHQEVSETVAAIAAGKETEAVSGETAANIQKAMEDGKVISTELTVEIVEKNRVDKEDAAEAEKVLAKNDVIAQYLNLEILLKVDDKVIGTVDELSKPIAFTVKIPDELRKDGRTFYIIRVHEGNAEKLPTSVNEDGTLTFSTNLFSTYALAYSDEGTGQSEEPAQPVKPEPDSDTESRDGTTKAPAETVQKAAKTGDSTNVMFYVILLAMCEGAILTVAYKKRV